jgi:hypothetical protein
VCVLIFQKPAWSLTVPVSYVFTMFLELPRTSGGFSGGSCK